MPVVTVHPQAEREAADRSFQDRTGPADLFAWATLLGALIAITARNEMATAFLVLTLLGLCIIRRFELPLELELSFAIGILLQGWGNALLLFERIGWYDKAVHFATPLLIVPSLYLLLARAGALPTPGATSLQRGTLGLVVVTISLGIALAAVWELIEGTSDLLLGTSLAHGYLETIGDLYASTLGSVAAGAVLAWWVAAGGGGERLEGSKPPRRIA